MSLFSERKGLKPVRSVLQTNSMDAELRNCLWSCLDIHYWRTLTDNTGMMHHSITRGSAMDVLFKRLWLNHFKKPLDTLNYSWVVTRAWTRKYFFDSEWYEVYDFIEFVADNYPNEFINSKFIDCCNSMLEREKSGYRFVGAKITDIVSEGEITEIEEALKTGLKPVTNHLEKALDFYADRKSPDYSNSIKESISAVEAICRMIAGDDKATLSAALKRIEKESQIELHPALKKTFDSLYGYTSDADGIRHALLTESNLDSEDAKFMLVSCSAFINYLVSKSSKAGINL